MANDHVRCAYDEVKVVVLNLKKISEKSGNTRNSLALFIRLPTIPITWWLKDSTSVIQDDGYDSVIINNDLKNRSTEDCEKF